jgi:D-serine deaminase-like pyridoxal phosphate-dependent protein
MRRKDKDGVAQQAAIALNGGDDDTATADTAATAAAAAAAANTDADTVDACVTLSAPRAWHDSRATGPAVRVRWHIDADGGVGVRFSGIFNHARSLASVNYYVRALPLLPNTHYVFLSFNHVRICQQAPRTTPIGESS